MRLILGSDHVSVSQMGPDFLLVDHPSDYPPSEAHFFLQVDQSTSQWKIRLPEGMSSASTRVAIELA